MNNRTATLNYSEKLVRDAVKAFWFRSIGWTYLVLLLVLCAYMVYWAVIGGVTWLVALGALLLMGVFMAAALYLVHYRGSMRRFRRMGMPTATFQAGDESFKMVSDIGASELSWRVVTEVWTFPRFWLLFFSRAARAVSP